MGGPRVPGFPGADAQHLRRGLRLTKIAACVLLALGGGGIMATALLGDRIARWSGDVALSRFDGKMGEIEVGWSEERVLRYAGKPSARTGDAWVYRLDVPGGTRSLRGLEYVIVLRDGLVVRVESSEWRSFY